MGAVLALQLLLGRVALCLGAQLNKNLSLAVNCPNEMPSEAESN